MKKLSFLLGASLFAAACTKVPAGNVGVKVYLLGTSKGVDIEELGVGRYWAGINEEIYIFPTFQQNFTWIMNSSDGTEASKGQFTFQSKEGLEASANIGISYHIIPGKVTHIFQKYRRGIDEITHIFMRNHIRDALQDISSKLPIESLYGSGKTEFLAEVEKKVKSKVEKDGIIVDKIYLVGSIKLPSTVVSALNAKIEATQRAQQRENELREAEAAAKKVVAEAEGRADSQLAIAKAEAEAIFLKAESQAKANALLSKSLNTNVIEYKRVQKWNGVLPHLLAGEKTNLLMGVNK